VTFWLAKAKKLGKELQKSDKNLHIHARMGLKLTNWHRLRRDGGQIEFVMFYSPVPGAWASRSGIFLNCLEF